MKFRFGINNPYDNDPTRILPDLQCSLLCEEVRQEVNGNFFLIGVINFIRVPQLPVVAFKLSVFNRWTAGVGQFTESVRLIAPDQTTVLRKGEVKFALQDAAYHATNVTLFGQVEFKTAGTYYVEVLVDDVMKLRYPVPVIVTPPPQPGGQNPRPPEAARPRSQNPFLSFSPRLHSMESDGCLTANGLGTSDAPGCGGVCPAPLRRLLLVQFIVAVLVGGTVVWLLRDAYFPTISAAIAQLPAAGEIRSGQLDWRGESPQLLAEGQFLALSVDREHSGAIRSPAHVQIEFGKTNLLIHSLLGYAEVEYPRGWIIAVNRTELSPLWGAWRPWLQVATVVGCGGVSPGHLVGAGDDLLRAGVADRFLCEPRPGLAGELAAGWRGAAAGHLRDDPGPFVLRSGGV